MAIVEFLFLFLNYQYKKLKELQKLSALCADGNSMYVKIMNANEIFRFTIMLHIKKFLRKENDI